MKTVLIRCINFILQRSRIKKDIHYKTLLIIILRQIFEPQTRSYNKTLSEEMKIAILECFELSSRQLEYEVVEQFMKEENKLLLGHCLFVCILMIKHETFTKIR